MVAFFQYGSKQTKRMTDIQTIERTWNQFTNIPEILRKEIRNGLKILLNKSENFDESEESEQNEESELARQELLGRD